MNSQATKESLRQKILQRHPQDLSQSFADYACVALILKGPAENLELGYIIRATNPHDRWSGQIAFPGGRRELQDPTDIQTAIRETFEEIGMTLTSAQLLGKIGDVQARKGQQMLEFYIRPFVFYISEEVPLNLNPEEVAEFFWHPVADLRALVQQGFYEYDLNGVKATLPATHMNRAVKLWGLSYLMTQDLLKTLG